MLRRVEALIMLLTLVMSGCLSPIEQEPDSAGSEDDVLGPSPFDHHLRIVDCTGFGARKDYTNYNAPIDGPPEWPENDMSDISGVEFDLYECEKVEWGPFSRGPLTFIIESHSNFDIPLPCQEIRGSGLMILSIGFSDPELVDYFRDRFGMPAYLANVSIDKDDGLGVDQWTWHWGPTEPQSHLTVTGDLGSEFNEGDRRDGFFWANGSAVNGVEITYQDATAAMVRTGESHGRLESPMALAEHGENDWIATTGWLMVPEIIGQVTEFDDWDCTPKGGSGGNQTR